MKDFHLPTGTRIGGVALRVTDLDRALGFYSDLLGFTAVEQDGSTAALAAGDDATPIIRLMAQPDAIHKPRRTTGLYHVAILLPSRAQLGKVLRRLIVQQYPLQGASDHLVSEALYLSDPDGNGLEIYRDRPRREWQVSAGRIAMATDPMDVEGVLGDADESEWTGIAPGTIIGHIHLHGADLARAEAFYSDALGFDVTERTYPGALFMSAGGYHHHLGVNTWAGGTPPPDNAVGLESYTITIPDEAGWTQAVERTGATVLDDGRATVRDPDNVQVVLEQA